MADSDVFGDSLFDEFNREDAPPASVSLSKINRDLPHNRKFINDTCTGHNNGSDVDLSARDSCVNDNTSFRRDSEIEIEKTKSSSEVLEAQLSRVEKENAKFKNLVGTDSRAQLDEGPLLEIIYMNQAFARRNHHEIESFVGHLLEKDQQRYSAESKLPTCAGRANIVCLAGNSSVTPTPSEKLRQMETGMVIGCSHYYQSFVMDIMGWPLVDYEPTKTDGWIELY